MNLKKMKRLQSGAVYQKLMAEYEAPPEEIKELTEALAVLARWKKRVRKDLKVKENVADFTVYDFEITEGVKVFVEQGANG